MIVEFTRCMLFWLSLACSSLWYLLIRSRNPLTTALARVGGC